MIDVPVENLGLGDIGPGTIVVHPAAKHHRHGPSSLRYKELCPCWRSKNSDSAASLEGTAMHYAAETGDFAELTNEEQAEAVNKCTELVAGELAPTDIVEKEVRLDIAGLTYGTADVVSIDITGRHAQVFDYKFGRNAVDDAEVNLQGISYAVGVFTRFPLLEDVKVWFLLPRRDEVDSHLFPHAELPAMVGRIQAVIASAEDPEAKPVFSPKACEWCAELGRCRAPGLMAQEIASQSMIEFELPPEIRGQFITDPSFMAKALIVAKVMDRWVSGVKSAAQEMALGGEAIPGFTLQERSNPRKVADAADVWPYVDKQMSIEEFLSTLGAPSLPELEKIISSKAPKGQKAKAAAKFAELLEKDGLVQDSGSIFFLKQSK